MEIQIVEFKLWKFKFGKFELGKFEVGKFEFGIVYLPRNKELYKIKISKCFR